MKQLFFLCLIVATLLTAKTFGQDKKAYINFPSPNAASLGLFGTIPVNNFTGIANIEIPLYELTENDLTIPIALRYHTASVKLNAHPGSVGLGWSLEGVGSISRVVNGLPDETKNVNEENGYYFNTSKMNVPESEWWDVPKLNQFANDLTYARPNYEVMPDIFYFNFMGYSGKFYLDHLGNWVVQCDKPLKVIFEPTKGGFITKYELREPIQNNMPYPASNSNNYFNKFTLVTEDGTQFVFGGTKATGDTEAVEYSTSYRNPYYTRVVPTSWFLTKIIASNKKTVEYTYEPGKLICSLANNYTYTRIDRSGGDGVWDGWLGMFGLYSLEVPCGSVVGQFDKKVAQGHLIFPVYLKQITCDNRKVIFNRSVTTELRYADFDMNHQVNGDNQTSFYTYFGNITDLQWEKYDAIEIKSASDVLLKKFTFTYTNSNTTRLKLLSVKEEDPAGKAGEVTKFFYNPNNMAPYCEDNVDHWGFFSNKTFNPQNLQDWLIGYPIHRQPDQTGIYNQYEILEKIQYPTLGYSVFKYEPHTYSRTVAASRTGFTSATSNQIAGGLRIKNISVYQPDKSLASSKDYYYVKLNAAQDNLTTGTSSGILNSESQYYWPAYQGKDLGGNTFTYDLFSSNSLLPTPFDDASHIGYSEVIEKTTNNGLIKYTYTNYDTDIYGTPHWDDPARKYIDVQQSIYSPYTSKAIERGKLTSQTIYKEDKTKVKEVFNYYTKTSSNFIRANYSELLNLCASTTASAQTQFGTSFVYYVYNYNLTKTEEILYNQTGAASSVKTTTEYAYNANNLVNKVTTYTSKGESLVQKTKYASDYNSSAAAFLPEILANFQVGYVMEQQVWKSKDNVSKLISGTLTEYAKYGTSSNLYLPSRQYGLEAANPLSEVEFGETMAKTPPYTTFNPNPTYYKENSSLGYTDFGKMSQVNLRGGINTAYIWGYNGLFPIAEVKNATTNQIAHTSFETDTDLGYFNYTSTNAAFYSTDAKTGTRSYFLFSGGVSHDLTRTLPAGNYIVSYWAKGTGNVQIGSKTPEAVNTTWKYQETTIILASNSDLRIRGAGTSVLLDEVRIIPAGSQVTTYTYHPLIGMTSSTDLNGRSTYFEYDPLGRLKLTRIDNAQGTKGPITKKLFYRYGK